MEIWEFNVKRLVIIASLATIGGFGATRAADATPIPMPFHVAPIDEALSMRITPTTELPPRVRGPIAALMRESVADRMIVGAVSVGAPAFETWKSPFRNKKRFLGNPGFTCHLLEYASSSISVGYPEGSCTRSIFWYGE